MKKSNKKGFILAEVIVISIVVISALIVIYTQFINVNNGYYRSFRYNTVDDLYAVNNIRSFIENDNYEGIIDILYGKNYLDLSDCSYNYFTEYNYCKKLLDTLNVKTLIFTYEDVSNLKNELKQENTLSEGMRAFIKTISSTKNNKYRIIVEFEDDRYATLKLGSFIVSNISDDCVKEGNICSIDKIKAQVSLNVAVNNVETYKFNVLADDGKKLTLIMNDYLDNSIYWNNSSVTLGPANILDYLLAETKDWNNILDIIDSSYNGCDTYNNCDYNVYSLQMSNSKTRLPMLQDLTNLGCTQTAGSCPSWLSSGLSVNGITGFWTSSTTNTNPWILNYDNRLNTTPINTNKINIKPVIIIDKSAI